MTGWRKAAAAMAEQVSHMSWETSWTPSLSAISASSFPALVLPLLAFNR